MVQAGFPAVGGREVGASHLYRPDRCRLLFLIVSGYLFSGSRPPSQVSRAGELPVSGKGTRESRGRTGKPPHVTTACGWGFRALCGVGQQGG